MIPSRTSGALRALALVALAAGLPGCAAVSALSSASAPLAAYSLTPLSGPGDARGSRHVVVDVPAASGAIATDRILVTPSRLEAAYLPAARWVDPAPVMMQTLLVQSLQSSGSFRLVGRQSLGLFPDNTLIGEIRAFQAEPGPPEGPAYLVRVALTLTLVRESDGALLGTRDFEATAPTVGVDVLSIARSFDVATGQVLRDVVGWTASAAGGGGV